MPRYPFSPELFDALPEELAELFRGLELTLLEEICSRLKISGQLNEVTVQDIRALRSHGIDLEDVKKAIEDTTNTGMDKLNKLLDDVVKRNQKYYTELIDLANVTAPERLVDERDISAIRRQTWSTYKNITGSMGFLLVEGGRLKFMEPAQAYEHFLDMAALQVQSGAVSYNQAISSAVKQLADSGIKTVDYESGHVDSVDVAVRRAVMTGVNQLNQKYREQSMDYLGTDLVEVTAHLGARNIDGPMGWENHEAWQGGIYRWNNGGIAPERNTRKTKKEPAPDQTTTATAPIQQGRRVTPAARDVTREYLDAATPNSHIVQDLQSYTVNGVTYTVDGRNVQLSYSQHEKEVAELLERKLGGELFMVPKVNNPQGVRTPDYLFRGERYDLKTLEKKAGKNTIFNRVKNSKGQAERIIIDITKGEVTQSLLDAQIEKIFSSGGTSFIDEIVIVSDGKIKGIYGRE